MKVKKGCDHKPKCDCTLGGDACLKRLEGKGPSSMRECHPPTGVLNKALSIHEGGRRLPDTKAYRAKIYWDTHKMG